jgi:DNA-directed RNA polymerase subunit N (RpoN/RPB10)
MIIPVRCFTCGKVLADKWEYYANACKDMEDANKTKTEPETEKPEKNTKKGGNKPETRGELLDHLNIHRLCCRRHFLGHVDLMDVI